MPASAAAQSKGRAAAAASAAAAPAAPTAAAALPASSFGAGGASGAPRGPPPPSLPGCDPSRPGIVFARVSYLDVAAGRAFPGERRRHQIAVQRIRVVFPTGLRHPGCEAWRAVHIYAGLRPAGQLISPPLADEWGKRCLPCAAPPRGCASAPDLRHQHDSWLTLCTRPATRGRKRGAGAQPPARRGSANHVGCALRHAAPVSGRRGGKKKKTTKRKQPLTPVKLPEQEEAPQEVQVSKRGRRQVPRRLNTDFLVCYGTEEGWVGGRKSSSLGEHRDWPLLILFHDASSLTRGL